MLKSNLFAIASILELTIISYTFIQDRCFIFYQNSSCFLQQQNIKLSLASLRFSFKRLFRFNPRVPMAILIFIQSFISSSFISHNETLVSHVDPHRFPRV